MAGCYPAAVQDRTNDLILKSYLNIGIDTFVCLQAEVDPEITEEQWRAGDGLRPYMRDAEKLTKKRLKWFHAPIIDGSVGPDKKMLALIIELIEELKTGRILYVHCWGGHGRTAVVVCVILAYMYQLTAAEVLKRVQRYHDCRIDPQGAKSPQTAPQRDQVKRLVRELLASYPAMKVGSEPRAATKQAESEVQRARMSRTSQAASCPALQREARVSAANALSNTLLPKRNSAREMPPRDRPALARSLPSFPAISSERTRCQDRIRQSCAGTPARNSRASATQQRLPLQMCK